MSERRDNDGDVQYVIKLGYQTCRICELESADLVDGRCPSCLGEEQEPVSPEEQLRQKRVLYRDAVATLRRIGRLDRAAWYEQQLAAWPDEKGGAA